MNPNETTKETEFIFRRLGDSFLQFATDLWQSVPLWLLVLAGVLVLAKIGYGRSLRRVAGKPDQTGRWLWWGAFVAVAALVIWTLVVFTNRDSEQVKSTSAPLSALGDSNKAMWFAFTAGIFALGCVFVVLMYIKDSRSIRWFWAVKLAALRITVYAILCFVFLLPSTQTWERIEKTSRVVVVLDITPSMTRVSDEVDSRGRPLRTRMDVLLDFLSDEKNESKVQFIQKILKQNPIVVYPFGTRLDDSSQTMARDSAPWSRDEWNAFVSYDFRPMMLKGLSKDGQDLLRASTAPVPWSGPVLNVGQKKLEPSNWADWAAMWVGLAEQTKNVEKAKRDKLVPGMGDEDDEILRDNILKMDRRVAVARTIALGTNAPDSLTAAVNRESPNMVQGVIVFSDGRSNLGSDSSYRELRDRATKEKIPIFTVAVGVDRHSTGITITDIQADDSVPPDQGFKAIIDVDGINLAGKSVDIELDLFYLGPDGKSKDLKTAQADFTFDASTNPKKVPYQVKFQPGDPPHGQIEFEIDPVKLAQDLKGAKVTEESKDTAIKKPVLKEGKWAVRARIPKHSEEIFADREHVRDRENIQVLQKKLRILAIASAPSREFQFLRNFLVREVQDQRATVTLLVQNEAGTKGALTPNPTEEVIDRFPNRLDLNNKITDPKEKAYNLNEYDLIIGFDPDWSEVTAQQAQDLQTWVQRQGGGFILIADRINTYQLIRQGTEPGSRLYPIVEMLPVVPDDVIAVKITAFPRHPRRLYLHPIPGSDLLKIDDTAPLPGAKIDESKSDPIAGWEEFFTDREKYAKNVDEKIEYFPKRGFYSAYPVKEVKPGAHVLAELALVNERGEHALRPWLVTNNPAAAWRTCFIGSGEIYRMYEKDKEYYERFWGKMMKYMAAKRNVKASRGRVLVSKSYISGTPIRVQAQLLSPSSVPYPPEGPGAIDPKFFIKKLNAKGEVQTIGPVQMVAKSGSSGFDGYYAGQIIADTTNFPPGEAEYQVEIDVPDSNGEKITGRFTIAKSDPEMDNTKPNIAALLAMAGDFDQTFQDRVPAAVRDQLKDSLPREAGGVQKLHFKIDQTGLLALIPECFKPDYQRSNIKGPVTDLWDKGIEFPKEGVPSFIAGKTLSWVMLVVIFLLCWEWLTRKLLRLA